jgi:L-alanine-DL-glutamate epimerase-like enolase superfamily enzyme
MMTRKNFLKGIMQAGVASAFLNSVPRLGAEQETGAVRRARIADVEIYPFLIEQKLTIRISLGEIPGAENVLVRLRTDDGVVGWGESSPYAPVTGDSQLSNVVNGKKLSKLLVGRNPFDVASIVENLNAATTGEPGIKAAFEMAVWDLCGKISGQPVRNLLGNFRDSFETDETIFIASPEEMRRLVQDKVRRGIRTIKIKVGESVGDDIERVRLIREAAGPAIDLRIDANQGWSPAETVKALREMESSRIQACEQPVHRSDWDGLCHVRRHSSVPIMADESVHSPSDAIELIRRDAADLINIKLMKSGGILQAVRIAQIAAAANIRCMVGCMLESRLGLTAAAHVVCSQPNIITSDLDSFTFAKIDPVFGGMAVRNGIVSLPDKPGLGVDIDPDWLKTLRKA